MPIMGWEPRDCETNDGDASSERVVKAFELKMLCLEVLLIEGVESAPMHVFIHLLLVYYTIYKFYSIFSICRCHLSC